MAVMQLFVRAQRYHSPDVHRWQVKTAPLQGTFFLDFHYASVTFTAA
jgi:hypothetical protein